MSARLQKGVDISDPWGRLDARAVVFGCEPEHEQPCLRDRATVAISSGSFSMHLNATRAELLAMADMLREAAETIPVA